MDYYFNAEAVLHLLLLLAGTVCLVIVALGLAWWFTELVESASAEDCRHDREDR